MVMLVYQRVPPKNYLMVDDYFHNQNCHELGGLIPHFQVSFIVISHSIPITLLNFPLFVALPHGSYPHPNM